MSILSAIKKEMDIFSHKYPILVLLGPRQSGKTHFLKAQFNNYRYVNLENTDNRNFALLDPNNFLKEYDRFVIFDEIQRIPELFSYIQTKVDEDRIMGQYILSGSQNFHLMQNIKQSLAGRVALFNTLRLGQCAALSSMRLRLSSIRLRLSSIRLRLRQYASFKLSQEDALTARQ